MKSFNHIYAIPHTVNKDKVKEFLQYVDTNYPPWESCGDMHSFSYVNFICQCDCVSCKQDNCDECEDDSDCLDKAEYRSFDIDIVGDDFDRFSPINESNTPVNIVIDFERVEGFLLNDIKKDVEKLDKYFKWLDGENLDFSKPLKISQSPGKIVTSFVPSNKKIGRNQICPCGSGKKYKKCHLDSAG